jgi:hypothetical protein
MTMKATSPRSPFTDWIHPLVLFRIKILAELEGAVSATRTSRRTVRAYVLLSNGSINVTSEGPCIRPAFERLYERGQLRSVLVNGKIHKIGCWLDSTGSELWPVISCARDDDLRFNRTLSTYHLICCMFSGIKGKGHPITDHEGPEVE